MANIQKIDSQLTEFVDFIHKGGKLTPFLEDIYLITLNVAGLDYVENISERFPNFKKGDHLELFRESDNKFDRMAIVVKHGGEKIGYVPRSDNVILANLMDAGKVLYGVIEKASSDELYKGYEFRAVEFKIFLKETL